VTEPRCLEQGPRGAVCGRLKNHPGSHEGLTFDGKYVAAWENGKQAQLWIQGAGPG